MSKNWPKFKSDGGFWQLVTCCGNKGVFNLVVLNDAGGRRRRLPPLEALVVGRRRRRRVLEHRRVLPLRAASAEHRPLHVFGLEKQEQLS